MKVVMWMIAGSKASRRSLGISHESLETCGLRSF